MGTTPNPRSENVNVIRQITASARTRTNSVVLKYTAFKGAVAKLSTSLGGATRKIQVGKKDLPNRQRYVYPPKEQDENPWGFGSTILFPFVQHTQKNVGNHFVVQMKASREGKALLPRSIFQHILTKHRSD